MNKYLQLRKVQWLWHLVPLVARLLFYENVKINCTSYFVQNDCTFELGVGTLHANMLVGIILHVYYKVLMQAQQSECDLWQNWAVIII